MNKFSLIFSLFLFILIMSKEIRFGIIGNVDSGKSTFIGVIKSNKLDDGRGDARKRILKHPHEKKSGRTSCITPLSVKIKNKSYIALAQIFLF